jgi:hypothetical protein
MWLGSGKQATLYDVVLVALADQAPHQVGQCHSTPCVAVAIVAGSHTSGMRICSALITCSRLIMSGLFTDAKPDGCAQAVLSCWQVTTGMLETYESLALCWSS